MKNSGMCYAIFMSLMIGALLTMTACGDETKEQNDDTDAPGDTDGNTDNDTDGDTDADTGGDTDTDADGDTDGDTDGDADTEALELCYEPTLSSDLCDPELVEFTTDSTNPYYPLIPGSEVILEGYDKEDEVDVRIVRRVLDETKEINGVDVHVLKHDSYQDGKIHEIAYNFYVETVDGNVCYFGEDVEYYEDEELINTNGTWRAGVDGAKPGLIMPWDPTVGDRYLQENAPLNDAIDMGSVFAVDETVTINGVTYDEAIIIMDVNPTEDCDEEERKVYLPGIGEVADVDIELVSFSSLQMSDAKLLIEHNATDEDTGFQGFADGDPWNTLTITGPDGEDIVTANAGGGLLDWGLTEFFFETSEPENDKVPISEVLTHLSEGTYTFTGDMVDGSVSTMTATFSHVIPAGPRLISPEDGATDVDPDSTVISWNGVTEDIEGNEVTIVGYQIIVEEDVEQEYPESFAKPQFSIYLPAATRSITVPSVFMESGKSYKYEVLAIEKSGNQTLSSAEFETK